MAARGWTIGAIAALIAVPIGIALSPLMNSDRLPDAAIRSAEAVRRLSGVDLLKMLNARSPGARAVGELADSKGHARALAKPRQRALAKVRQAKPLPDTFVKPLFGEAPITTLIPPDKIPTQLAETPAVLTQGPAIPPIIAVGPPAGGGGGGGGEGGGGGGVTPNPPVVVPPAVPEPSTWVMMLMGFGAVGTGLRRRRRQSTSQVIVAQ